MSDGQAVKVKTICFSAGVQLNSILFGTALHYNDDGLGWKFRLWFWPFVMTLSVRR